MTFHDFLETKRSELLNSQRQSILAVDSSTQLASVALSVKGQIIFQEECFRQKSHSEWINGAVDRALKSISISASVSSSENTSDVWDQVDLLAVTHGPGSFTGLRVATNLVKTLAYAKDKPIVSYSSLELLAHQAECVPQQPYIFPAINAFKNMVFMSVYQTQTDGSLKELIHPFAVDIDKARETVFANIDAVDSTKVQVIGDGFFSYKSYLDPEVHSYWIRPSQPLDYPLASTLVKRVQQQWSNLKLQHWRELTPTYIRASAAEENKF